MDKIHFCWRPLSITEGGANAWTIKQTLLLGGFRSRSRRCGCRRRWRSRCLRWFSLLFGCWLRCLLGFAPNTHCGNINHQNHCEEKKNPLLHVTSPPF